jgi:hypothetical protein
LKEKDGWKKEKGEGNQARKEKEFVVETERTLE